MMKKMSFMVMNKKRSSPPSSCPPPSKRTKIQGPWSFLAIDILRTISHLLIPPDQARFSMVCRSWRSAAARATYSPARQMPWLMLPSLQRFFDPWENNFHELPLPNISWTKICGSVKWWVATMGDKHQIHLWNLNPFARLRRASLPSLSTISDFNRVDLVRKLCLPSSPAENPKGTAVIICCTGELIFAKLGGRKWSTVSCSKSASFVDVVSYKGRFYAVNEDGDVMKLDLRRRQAVELASHRAIACWKVSRIYLVESAGELLQVVHHRGTFSLFQLDVASRKWYSVWSLGERSLFLGENNYSMSVAGSELSGCRSNCIYSIRQRLSRSRDSMGVYSMEENNEIEAHCMDGRPAHINIALLWVTPFFQWQH